MKQGTCTFRFMIGFEVDKQVEMTMSDCRLYGRFLAFDRQKRVKCLCFNRALCKWDELGTYTPEGYMIDSFGYILTLNREGNGFDTFGKWGEVYTKEQVTMMAKRGGPILSKISPRWIEFDNGVVFTYDEQKGGFVYTRGSGYPGHDKFFDNDGKEV